MKNGQAIITYAEMKHAPYNLKGSSLEVFSALYSLTKKRAFLGSYEDLASWIEIEVKTLRRALSKLQERGLVSIEQAEGSAARYEFQAHQIKGYPLPDYKYCGKRSYTDVPIIDSQNIEEYRSELEQGQNVPTEGQNVRVEGQNVRVEGQNVLVSKEKNQKKNNYNIYTKNIFNDKENYTQSVCVVKKEKGIAHTHTSKEVQKIIDYIPYPTTLQEIWDYAQEKQPGISRQTVTEFFAHYKATGWKFKHGGYVKDWKAELFNWDQRSKRWEKEKAARTFTRYQQGAFAHGGIYARGGTPPSLAQIMAERAIAQQKEADRRLAEEHDKEANTPEALAARDRVLAKFCK